MSAQSAYDELIRRSREQAVLSSCSALLGWDEQTYMPTGGSEHRAEQLALLAGLHHDQATDPRIGELLAEVEGSSIAQNGDSPEAANVRGLRRGYDRLTKLPRSLVEELARTTSIAQQEWIAARKENDFGQFLPWLERIVTLKQQEAEAIGFETVAYDALLDEYEPDAKSADLARLFTGLREALVPMVGALTASARRPDPTILARRYPVDQQRAFGESAAKAVGFDFERGRLDTTAHPFCSGIGPGDCRITTRFDEHDFSNAFFGILHEVGHGLYDQGLLPEHFGTPMGEAVSLGVHESQSRLWENAVGRSEAFWRGFFPTARQFFPEALGDVSGEEFHRAVNHVEPSLIRTEADEVTYNLHIIIRFELEQALLSGDLRPSDLPGAWNDAYERMLGIVPPNDAEGCLQDIHWSAGLFGYFPTYTLGNLFSAQLFAAADRELGGLAGPIARGRFSDLLEWLRDRVHRQGRRYRSATLIERATGSPPDPRFLIDGLKTKYGALYGL